MDSLEQLTHRLGVEQNLKKKKNLLKIKIEIRKMRTT